MDHFHYRDGELFSEGVRLADIAAAAGTPTFVYSSATLALHYQRIVEAYADLHPTICFAVKACPNISILRTLARMGAGMDVVSGGELYRARLAGVAPSKITFAGVGKTDAEIRDALRGGSNFAGLPAGTTEPIAAFNIESEPEYTAIAAIARQMGVTAHAAIRVNPGVKAGGHEYIETGTSDTKFGVSPEHALAMLKRFGADKHLRLTGLHMHIGSSIQSPTPYADAIARILKIIDDAAAFGVTIDSLDLGGGFGADYTTGASPSAKEYAAVIVPLLRDRVQKGLKITIEPGRTIVANAGVLLTRVLYVKVEGPKKFLVCDAGMNTLLRPSLYEAFHFIWPASVAPMHEPRLRTEKPDLPGLEPCDVVGPICETGDFFAKDRPLPTVARGELLCLFAAGAYGMSMSSRYNSHPLAAEVLVEGDTHTLIRRRETLADLVSHEL